MEDEDKVSDAQDYSYFNEDNVCEEYLESLQIEIDEDEVVEIIEVLQPTPPPSLPFSFFPMPPFSFLDNVSISDSKVEQNNAKDKGTGNSKSSSSDRLSANGKKRKNVRRQSASPAVRYSDMLSARSAEIAGKGEEQAKLISREQESADTVRIFKIGASVVGVFAMLVLCFGFVFWNYRAKTADNKNYTDSSGGTSSLLWNMGSSEANDIIKKFYDSLGDISVIAEYRDMLVKGTLTINGKSEKFYCIRRSNGNCYLKIGTIDEERAYYISGENDGVFKLADMRVTGRREPVSVGEGLIVRALAHLDENMYKLAYGKDVRILGSTVGAFTLMGQKNVDGKLANVLKSFSNGVYYRYRFSVNDGSLLSTAMEFSQTKLVVEYSDYRDTNVKMKFPFSRKLTLNGKPYADVTVRSAMVNKGFVIP